MDIAAIVLLTCILDLLLGLEVSNLVRIVLGVPFVLFVPGYTLIGVLFPKNDDLDGIERVALSFGLSIAVVPLIGLILNYTPWGITTGSIAVSLTLFVVAMSAGTWYRRRKIPEENRFVVHVNMPSFGWGEMAGLDRVLSIALVAAILGALVTLGYVIAVPKQGESFTEFYVLGLEGMAAGYPEDIVVGEEGRVVLGIVNHEHEEVSYRVKLRISGESAKIWMGDEELDQIEIDMLAHEETWEREIGFKPQQVSEESQKVEFLLWKDIEGEPEEDSRVSSTVSDTSIDLWFGEVGRIAIVNEVDEEVDYKVVLRYNSEVILEESRALAQEQEWFFENNLQEGTEVLVYKNDALIFSDSGAYLSLHLWIDVESL